jgi:D-xylose transport system substrate-binding protein
MTRTLLMGLTAVAAGSLLITGCAGITIGAPTQAGLASGLAPIEASDEASASAGPSMAAGTVGIVLPNSTSGSCWAAAGQKVLEDAFAAKGIPVSVKNAEGDATAFTTMATDFVSQGAAVLVVVTIDATSGAEAIAAANGNGIPAVDYDHLTPNGGAQYFVGVTGTPDCTTLGPEVAKAEADALVSLAAALTSDDPTTADALAVDMTTDTEAGYDVPSILVTP